MVAGSLLREGYLLRLYWWVDLIATGSMLLDLPHLVAAAGGV